VVFIFLFSLSTLSASAQDFKRLYKSAKDSYQDGKYNLAMEEFKPLMVYDQMNPYTEYALLYYSICAYQQSYYTLAKESLIQIKTLYPEWDQMDEVNYWLAAVYFQQGEIFQALRMLYAMKSPRDLSSIERMKNNYLLKIYDEEVIRLVLEEFPGESALLKRVITRKVVKGEFDQARELIEMNGLNQKDFDFPDEDKIIFKDQYRVAALFPFLSATLEPSPGAKLNQAALDLYQGMKLANDSLRKLDIKIELVGYDTERQPETVSRLMSLDEMRSADVLLGPLFSDELAPVKEFSKNYSVPLVNPVSSSPDFAADNSNAILIQPDYSAIGIASAEALAKLKINRPSVVLYGDTPKDSAMAFAFLKKAEELNLKIALSREITKANSNVVYSTLVSPTKYDKFRNPIEFTIKKDSIGSVFVASDDELIFTKVISSIDRRGDSVIIIGQDSWIDKPSMDFDKFERLHIMMASPEYTNVLSPEYQLFRSRYAQSYGVLPTIYSKIGFECMMFLGRQLKEHGIDFPNKLKKGDDVPGSLGRLYRFQDSQCNKEVPFTIFEYGELRILY
jgi:tetratricopeptide (TPR) repeat protein